MQNPNGYALYFYKNGYIPYESNPDWHGTHAQACPNNPYHMTRKDNCNSPLSVSVTSTDHEQIDVTVTSAITLLDNGVDHIPPAYADHYDVNTRATLWIYNSTGSLVNTSVQEDNITYSANNVFTFSWIPPYDDTFSYIANSDPIDPQCHQDTKQLVNSTTENSEVEYASAPVISNILVSSITNQSAIITWNTDKMSDSIVRYGAVSGTYTFSETDNTYVAAHSITLAGLDDNTTYFFVVNSSNSSVATAQSAENNFTTPTTLVDNPPVVFQISPADGNYSVSNNMTFVCNASDDHLIENLTLYTNITSWSANITNSSGNYIEHTLYNIPNGDYIWNCLAYDNASQSGWGVNRTFSVNYTVIDNPPAVLLNSPGAGYVNNSATLPVEIGFNCSAADDNSLSNISLFITDNQNSSFSLNSTAAVLGTQNQSLWNLNLTNGTYTWNCLAYDNASQYVWGVNRSLLINYTPVMYNVTINEFLAHLNLDEYVELYNNEATDVDISGWHIADNAGQYSLPAGSIIGSGSFYIFYPGGNIFNDGGDNVTLLNEQGTVIDTYEYNFDPGNNITMGRYPDGTVNWYNLSMPTPNASNVYDIEAPNVTLISPADSSGLSTGNINFTCNATNHQLSNITLWANTAGTWHANQTAVVSGQHTSSEFNVTGIPDGDYIWNCQAYDIFGNSAYAQNNWSFSVDSTSPLWSGNSTDPNSSAVYSPGADYQLNVTWNDTNIDAVLFEHNFTGSLSNYSVAGNLSQNYYYNWTGLGAGTYVWRSYANDTSGNWNMTDQWTFIVQQASSAINLTLNNSYANATIGYGENITINATILSGESIIQLYDNLALINSGGSPLVNTTSYSSTGEHNITVVYPETQNYTSSNLTLVIDVVDSAVPIVTLLIPEEAYSTSTPNTTFRCNASNYELKNISLWINNTGTWHANQTVNISGQYNESEFKVTEIPDGYYIWNCQAYDSSGNSAYAASNRTFIVDSTAPVWYANKTSPDSGIAYSQGAAYQFNVSWNESFDISDIWFEHNFTGSLLNDTSVYNNSNEYFINISGLAAGAYSWRSYADDTAGNMNVTDQWRFTVSKAQSALNLTLNNNNSNITWPAYTPLGITANLTSPQGKGILVYNNGSAVYNASSPFDSTVTFNRAGLFNITAVFEGNQNYTSNYSTFWVNVTGDVTIVDSSVMNVSFTNGTYTAVDLNASIYRSTLNISNVTGDHLEINDSYLYDSVIIDSRIFNCTILESNLTSALCENSFIDPSDVLASNVTGNSTIIDSHVYYSNVSSTNITAATVDNSTLVQSLIGNNSIIDNGTIFSSTINNTNITDSYVNDGVLLNSTVNLSNVISTNMTNSGITSSDSADSVIENSTVSAGSNITGSFIENATIINSNITQGSNIIDSDLTDSSVENSNISQESNITGSDIAGSVVESSNITLGSNITDSDVTGSVIENATVSEGSNITDSAIADSDVINSNITAGSNITDSVIENTVIENSNITDSNLTDVNMINSAIENSTLSGTNVTDANITDDILYNGTIILPDGSLYNATQNGTQNLTSVVNYAPIASFSTSISNLQVTVNDQSSDANEGSALLNNTWVYSLDYGDGTVINSTEADTDLSPAAHTYSSAGDYTITLNITDAYAETDSYSAEVTVSAGGGSDPPGGSGGSGGSSGTTHRITLTSSGSSLWLSRRDKAVFDFNGEQHEASITSLTASTATIRVASTPSTAVFNVMDEILFDLDDDLEKDMSITLAQISGSKALITIRLSSETSMPEVTRTEAETSEEKTASVSFEGPELPKRRWREEIDIDQKEGEEEASSGYSLITGMASAFNKAKEEIFSFRYINHVFAGIVILSVMVLLMHLNKKLAEGIEKTSGKNFSSKKSISKNKTKKK